MEFSSSSSSTSSQYKGSAFSANINRPRWELPIYESTPHFPQPSPMENRLIGVNSREISSSILESGRLASSSSPSYTHYYAYGYSNYNHGGGGACAAGKEATMTEKREGGGDLPPGESAEAGEEEREHMFDKVVTPSDVGKLNRLVIPKQQAEKYFPLDSSSSEKGLLLDFEDRNGKSWRFRYSYWNSSQSYVMTKGWSRFVKEKKLDAGDVVSFQRGLGDDAAKDRFYIDWRRRPAAPPPLAPPHHHHIQFQRGFSVHRPIHHQPFLLAGPRPPPPLPPPPLVVHPQARDQRQLMNFVSHPNQHSIGSYNGLGTAATWSGYNGQNNNNYGVLAPNLCHQGSVIYMRGSTQHQMQLQGELAGISRRNQTTSSTGASSDEHMVFDSVPVVPAAVKRFRLFGVNMDCALTDGHDCESPVNPRALMSHTSSSTEEVERSLQLRLHGSAGTSNSMDTTTDFLDKGKSSTSLDFDLR